MTTYNFVRVRVKPGAESRFLELNRQPTGRLERLKKLGLRRGGILQTGERSFCFFGEWESPDALSRARPELVADLERVRDLLEDLGGNLGLTDPVSGEAVLEFA
jgi:hypothetical protein